MKKLRGSVTKTTPAGAENKLATRLKSPAAADLKLFINLVFFMSFFLKRLKVVFVVWQMFEKKN
jgi:hypothetical protein